MTDTLYRALVVDDEAAVRNLTIRALQREGFSCDAAPDGLEAKQWLDSHRYDVVVTDLRMPNRHGHALASELLALKDRPVVVILTGVLEPKLARDLTLRGADWIQFKPVDYLRFAAEVRVLAQRWRHRSGLLEQGHEQTNKPLDESLSPDEPAMQADDGKIPQTLEELQAELDEQATRCNEP